jgi:hypothetical protein
MMLIRRLLSGLRRMKGLFRVARKLVQRETREGGEALADKKPVFSEAEELLLSS